MPTIHFPLFFLFHLPLETGRPNAVATFVRRSNLLLFVFFYIFFVMVFLPIIVGPIDFPM